MRRQLEREEPERLRVRMWLYPWLTWAAIVAIVAVIGSMALVDDEATRSYLLPSLISLAVVVAAAFLRQRLADRPTPSRRPAPRRDAASALPGR
jgi:GABA permease